MTVVNNDELGIISEGMRKRGERCVKEDMIRLFLLRLIGKSIFSKNSKKS